MRVLCSCVPAYGHYLPMVGIARALQDAGHDVTFVTAEGFDRPAVDGFSLWVAGEASTGTVAHSSSEASLVTGAATRAPH